MNPGSVVLIPIPQRGGGAKLRPAVVISILPGTFQSLLICGISTQMMNVLPNGDDPIGPGDADFAGSGLHQASVIRLSFVRAAGASEVVRTIGKIDDVRLARLRQRLRP